MSSFRKMFGSKNRKNFKPGVEPKQTVDGQKNEEKYSTYDEKKQHEAELWAKLILKGKPQYTESNANSLGLEYIADTDDPEYSLKLNHYQAVSCLKMWIPDGNCCVCRITEKVNLTTLRNKESKHSGTVKFLAELKTLCCQSPHSVPHYLWSAAALIAGIDSRTQEIPNLNSAFKKVGSEALIKSLGKELGKNKYALNNWGVDLCLCLLHLKNKKLEKETYRLL